MAQRPNKHLEFHRKFPLMIPNHNFTQYNGYFTVGSKELRLHVNLPQAPLLAELEIVECSWQLSAMLRNYQKDIKKWRNKKSSFLKFMEWLQDIAEAHLPEYRDEENLIAPLNQLEDLIASLEEIGVDKLSSTDKENLQWVELRVKVNDHPDTEYILKVKINDTGRLEFEALLPEAALEFIHPCKTIKEAYNEFEIQVNKLQKFWTVMEELDSNCWILDAANKGIVETRRQIAIAPDISFIINVDPYNPLSRPELNFLGSEVKVDEFQDKIIEWPKEGDSLLEKLRVALDVPLPGPPESQNLSQMSQDEMCCVCLMASDLNETCDGCKSNFHLTCLRGWLKSVPSNVVSFNRIAGKCPVCQGPISCLL